MASSSLTSDDAARLIRHMIAAQGLVPGDRLGTEAELAGRLGTTRAAVREGVRLLAQTRLVRATRGPGGGVFVLHTAARSLAETVNTSIETMLRSRVTSFNELIEVRMLLEVPLAGLAAARADAAAIECLHACVEQAAGGLGDGTIQRAADERFHRTIAEAAANPVAAALVSWSHVVLAPVVAGAIATAIVDAVAVEQHRVIAGAIDSRKSAAAERAMREHLRYVSDVLETVLPSPA